MSRARAKVKYATIFVFPSTPKGKAVVSATPETLTVRAGDVVDWTVVNATATPGRISIKWKDKNPLKGEPKEFERAARATVRSDVKSGRKYRYSILLDGVEVFDPELEVM
jgi:hypothetical protein